MDGTIEAWSVKYGGAGLYQKEEGLMSFGDKLKMAGEYQVTQIADALKLKNLELSREEIQDRLLLAMYSHSLTTKIVEQIKSHPKEMTEMSLEEKYAAAGWARQQEGNQGSKEESRALIAKLMGKEATEEDFISEVSQKEAKRIIDTRQPRGRFFLKDCETAGNQVFIGIDNTSGNAWTETFVSPNDCTNWLKGGERSAKVEPLGIAERLSAAQEKKKEASRRTLEGQKPFVGEPTR